MHSTWFEAFRGHRIPDWVFVAALLAVALSLYLAWTCGRWLPGLLGILDRFLSRVGFGTWSARFLTRMEARFGKKWGRRDGNGESGKGRNGEN